MQSQKTQQNDSTSEEKKKGFPRFLVPLIIIIVLAFAAIVLIPKLFKPSENKPGCIRVSGRIEGYETNIGAKIPGRVEIISKREGDEVKQNEDIVKLSDNDIQAQLRGAKAKEEQAQQQINESEEQLEVAREQVRQSALNVKQAQEDAQGRIEQAVANVATQEAQLEQARSEEVQAKADLELAAIRIKRYDDLVVKGAVTQDEDDQAHSTYKSAVATVEARKANVVAAQKQVEAAKAAVVLARSNTLNPPIRRSQQSANVRTVAQNEAGLEKAKLEVKNAKASIDEIEANIAYLNIKSPIHGIVTARTVEPGAVVAAGQTVLSLIDLNDVFLRAYVPDSEIGKVRINQKADIFYDSAPNKVVSGTVTQIDPKASFTPENIYFRDDRVKQVFGIKIKIDNPEYYAKPGMPADADIHISDDVAKERERESGTDEKNNSQVFSKQR